MNKMPKQKAWGRTPEKMPSGSSIKKAPIKAPKAPTKKIRRKQTVMDSPGNRMAAAMLPKPVSEEAKLRYQTRAQKGL